MAFARTTLTKLSVIALFAMACVHVLRPVRGFECDCGDTPVFTVRDHCHGPHSEGCHEDDEDSGPCHHDQEHPAGDDTHSHKALIESLLAVKADASLFASMGATTPVLLTVIEPPAFSELGGSAPRRVPVRTDRQCWPQILSHTIALLV